MTQADRVHSTPTRNSSSNNIAAPTMDGCVETKLDIEDTLDRAFYVSSLAVNLAERTIFSAKAPESLADLHTYLIWKQDVDTLLFALHETHAQIRESRDQYLLWENSKELPVRCHPHGADRG